MYRVRSEQLKKFNAVTSALKTFCTHRNKVEFGFLFCIKMVRTSDLKNYEC